MQTFEFEIDAACEKMRLDLFLTEAQEDITRSFVKKLIEDGRVTPSDRYVNFIHVDDLARVLYQAMVAGERDARYIASDGKPMRWSEIINKLGEEYGSVLASDD